MRTEAEIRNLLEITKRKLRNKKYEKEHNELQAQKIILKWVLE